MAVCWFIQIKQTCNKCNEDTRSSCVQDRRKRRGDEKKKHLAVRPVRFHTLAFSYIGQIIEKNEEDGEKLPNSLENLHLSAEKGRVARKQSEMKY